MSPSLRQKRRSRHAHLTREQVKAAHVMYREAGLSLRALAQLLWQRFGYANPSSCRHSLEEAFSRDKLLLRSRSEGMRLHHAHRRADEGEE